jgi:rabenosyn-5
MFPLQSLPKPAKRSKSDSSTASEGPLLDSNIDPDSELAHALQPLLEQEALLETFVQEAKSHRKFEDAQTLKTNLEEIRAEIDRIVANADRAGKQAKQR